MTSVKTGDDFWETIARGRQRFFFFQSAANASSSSSPLEDAAGGAASSAPLRPPKRLPTPGSTGHGNALPGGGAAGATFGSAFFGRDFLDPALLRSSRSSSCFFIMPSMNTGASFGLGDGKKLFVVRTTRSLRARGTIESAVAWGHTV